MKTDPRKACANVDERLFWAIVHDLVAHPLMAATCWAEWTVRFHNWTSTRAWPRKQHMQATGYYVSVHDSGFGWIRADHLGGDFYRVRHPRVMHTFVTTASGGYEAAHKAIASFRILASEFGGQFAEQLGSAP